MEYLYSAPSRYLLRGTLCTGLDDARCHFEVGIRSVSSLFSGSELLIGAHSKKHYYTLKEEQTLKLALRQPYNC